MARVTVEDCLENVDNRFQLVLVASKRARQLMLGAEPKVERENDKATVMALREIADGHITQDLLTESEVAAVLETEVMDEAADTSEAGDASVQASGQEGAPTDE